MIMVVLGFCLALWVMPFRALAYEEMNPYGINFNAVTEKTTYQAGDGTVTWTPTMNSETGEFISGILTLVDAEIELEEGVNTAFDLPNVPVKVEFVGENYITSRDGNAGVFRNRASVELTGTGVINCDTHGIFVDAGVSNVKITGLSVVGRFRAGSVELNDINIPANKTLALEGAQTVTATNVENNGQLTLTTTGTGSDDIEMIKSMKLTGSGVVLVRSDESSWWYTNDGIEIPTYDNLDFTMPSGITQWNSDARVDTDGYEFTGNSIDGYTLKLGNIMIESTGLYAIRLPEDGPTNIVLTEGTIARVYYGTAECLSIYTQDEEADPCTITGTGKLILFGSGPRVIATERPLIIEGGDIEIRMWNRSDLI